MRLAIGASPDKAAQKTAPEKAVAEGGGALASSELGRDLAQLPQAEHRAHVEKVVLALVEEVSDQQGIGAEVPLMEAGVDSLAATELVRRLWQLSAKPLPTTLLFECPTVSAIVGRILGQEAPSAETARVRRGAELSAAGIEDERVHVQVRVRGS